MVVIVIIIVKGWNVKKTGYTLLALLFLVSLLPTDTLATEQQGTLKLGYISIDREGNQGIDQNSFNLYEGAALSLENYTAYLNNGFRINADLKNITLKNRNLFLGVNKPGYGGVQFRHSAYRRVYDFDGDLETKRTRTGGNFWWQAHQWFKVTGDISVNDRSGEMTQLFAPGSLTETDKVDFQDTYYGVGLTYHRNRTTASVEYRGSSFSDSENELDDRTTKRMRATFATPVPKHEAFSITGGFQYYQLTVKDRSDTLTANTGWAGLRFFRSCGLSLGYNIVFDRADRTGDFVATDNITHAFSAAKVWRGRGGVNLGYRYSANDDVFVKRTGNSFSASGWYKPLTALTLRAGHGMQTMDVDEGRTLTGRRDRDRSWASARYAFNYGWVRVKMIAHQVEYEDLESSADYVKGAADAYYDFPGYGNISGSYAYYKGDYSNSGGRFIFADHTVAGDITTTEYKNARVGFGGTYWRSRRDQDIESFSVRFSGWYSLENGLGLELTYRSHNFDNFNDPSPVYTEYYTDNIVEVTLSYKLK